MPTIKYPNNPNVETAFVEQDDGTKNRAVLTAPQDISTIEYPNNPNSTKAYITVNGKKQRVVMTADIAGGGSGGGAVSSVNGKTGAVVLTASDVGAATAAQGALADTAIQSVKTINNQSIVGTGNVDIGGLPSQTGNAGKFLTTDGTDASWSDKPLVNTATTNSSLAILGDVKTGAYAYSNYAIGGVIGRNSAGNRNTAIGSGTLVYSNDAQCATAIGSDARCYQSYGIAIGANMYSNAEYAIQLGANYVSVSNKDTKTFKVYNGNNNYELMSADGTIPEARLADTTNATAGQVLTLDSNLNAVWQAGGSGGGLPSQTGNAGKFLTTDGTDASWSDKPLANESTGQHSIKIGGGIYSAAKQNAVTIGNNTQDGADSITIGVGARVFGSGTGNVVIGSYGYIGGNNYCIAIGDSAKTGANNTIQLNASGSNQTNSDANTFKVANANGNFEIMSADGTIPAARHASLPSADGTYILKLVISSGVPTLSWVSE